jgi:hypothetical protein
MDTQKVAYIVTRNGIRVSDQSYASIEEAKVERDHWVKLIKRWPDNSVIKIEPFNEVRHRV